MNGKYPEQHKIYTKYHETLFYLANLGVKHDVSIKFVI